MTQSMTSKPRIPKSIWLLCLTQLWERFCFFGIAAIFVTFYVDHLHHSDTVAFNMFGSFLTLSYCLGLYGGWLGDNAMKKTTCVMYGTILLIIGSFLLANHHYILVPVGLAFVAIGSGLFTTNISAHLGEVAEGMGCSLNEVYTIFYIAINLGAALGIIICGFIARHLHWYLVFVITSIGGVFSLLSFLYYGSHAKGQDIVNIALQPFYRSTPVRHSYVIFSFLLIVLLNYYLVQHYVITGIVLTILTACGLVYLTLKMHRQSDDGLRKMLVIGFVVMIYIIFMALFGQMTTSINLFNDRFVNLTAFGIALPPSTLQSLNPLMVLLFGPVMIYLWNWLKRRNIEPPNLYKIVFSLVVLCCAFVALFCAAYSAEHSVMHISILWVVLVYVLLTLSELMVGPIGISTIKCLAPQNILSLIMAIWFVGRAYGNYLSAFIAKLSAQEVDIFSPQKFSAKLYADEFWVLLIFLAVFIVVTLICLPSVRRLLK